MHKVREATILRFLAAAAVIGLSINYFLESYLGENWALALFAATVVALAWVYPRISTPLPREAVDFWYYVLIVVAVIGFFIQNETQRLELDFSARTKQLNSELAELEGRIAALDKVISEGPDRALESLRNEARALSVHRQSNVEYVCACAVVACNPVPDRMRNPIADAQTDWGKYWQQSCEKLKEDKIGEMLAQLAAAKTLDDLRTLDMARLQAYRLRVTVSGTTLPLYEVVFTLINLRPDLAVSSNPRIDLQTQISQKVLNRKALEDAHETRMLESRGVAAGLMAKFWPYVLVALLGLKLARFKYVF